MDRNARTPRHACGGFTLMELLIVVGVIAVLIGLVVAVGSRGADLAKTKTTRETILALDAILTDYMGARQGQIPPAAMLWPDSADQNERRVLLVGDGRISVGNANPGGDVVNSVGLFLRQSREVPSCEERIRSLPTKLVSAWNPQAGVAENAGAQPTLPTVFDAWGRPIRYVHPKFDGLITGGKDDANPSPTAFRPSADVVDLGNLRLGNSTQPLEYAPGFEQFRRNNAAAPGSPAKFPQNVGDSDGGTCINERPYFYSAGPDGRPETTEDNVYSTVPKLPSAPR